jgi:predicted DNA-binding protein
MENTTRRQQTSFRLSTDLLERLKVEAKKSNRSLNNYVESALRSVVYHEPNEETQEAINEVRSGKHLNNKPLDMTSVETMIESILE